VAGRTTPVGGPLIGWIIAMSDPRAGLAVGGVSCLVAALGGYLLAKRLRPVAAASELDLLGATTGVATANGTATGSAEPLVDNDEEIAVAAEEPVA
jgi:hypothetical protein